MSLLPLLIMLYLGFYYIFPKIPETEGFTMTDPVVQVMIWTMVLIPLIGVSIVITMAKRIEKLVSAIKMMEEKSHSEIESHLPEDSHDEIGELSKQFLEMRKMISRQIEQLDDFKAKLDESNMKVFDANRQLKELSIRDGLTSLFNRRYFDDRLEEEVQRSQRYNRKFALEMVDIDHFKQLNDTHGHLYGDEILKKIALIMVEKTRDTDIVCRYGGEEFVIMLIEVDEQNAYAHAERLREAIASSLFSNGQGPLSEQITISVGVACFPQDANDKKRLLNSSDSALYAAKHGGRNQVRIYSKLEEQERSLE